MPWYFCLNKNEEVWVCPLHENFVFRDGREEKCGFIAWANSEIQEHLKSHGIEDTQPYEPTDPMTMEDGTVVRCGRLE